MSKFTVEFTLKQHTPIIHFQSEQKGATLRATELKPKFDRFITNTLRYVNKSIYEKYKNVIENEEIFPNKKGSTSYKISIQNNSIGKIETPKAYVNKNKEQDSTAYQAPYFADINKSIIATHDIKVTIKSFHQELLSLIDEIKDYVFIYENFGTRQSKGFGSFLRTDITNTEINTLLDNYINPVFEIGTYKDYKTAFFTIDTFYKKIKMGINKPYFKSLLFQYMCELHNIGWEKKFIKNNFPQVIHGEHKPISCKEPDDTEFRYIRAVLGLAEHNEFRPPEGKKQVKIKSLDEIERFKSPVIFKVFHNKIYLMFDNSYKDILNKNFEFSLDRRSITLKTPAENFNMYDFFKFVEKKTSLIQERK